MAQVLLYEAALNLGKNFCHLLLLDFVAKNLFLEALAIEAALNCIEIELEHVVAVFLGLLPLVPHSIRIGLLVLVGFDREQ